MVTDEFNRDETIRTLVDAWCDRREYQALATILPAWTSDNGLPDGWAALYNTVEHLYANGGNLPIAERDELKHAYVAIGAALAHRT